MLSALAKDLRDTLKTEPQTKVELCDILSCDDRKLRYAAAELRAAGYNIASSSHCSGYWLGSPEEMEIVAMEYESRAWKCQKIAEAIRKGPDLGQLEVKI